MLVNVILFWIKGKTSIRLELTVIAIERYIDIITTNTHFFFKFIVYMASKC